MTASEEWRAPVAPLRPRLHPDRQAALVAWRQLSVFRMAERTPMAPDRGVQIGRDGVSLPKAQGTT
jgi:hypothetical protein